MATDLEIAVTALQAKKPVYDSYWAYRLGNAPLVYNTARLRDIFKDMNARFTQNWAAVVIDSVLDRLELRPPTVVNSSGATNALAELWEQAGLPEDTPGVHEDVCVTGEGFVVVWPDEQGRLQAFHNDARLVHVQYEADNPRRKRFAAKWWWQDDGTMRLTIYYPDRLEYYATRQRVEALGLLNAAAFVPTEDEAAANPYGAIPVFHFRSTSRAARSQLMGVTELQDAINKLLADMMVAAEFGAFRQRWAITDANVSAALARPDTLMRLPPADTGVQPVSVGEFEASDLNNYLASISHLATSIGIITRTPKHYFYGQGGDPSGEALIAMEAPLTRKVQRLQAALRPVWRELAAFLLGMGDTSDIYVGYEPVETVQPMTAAQIVLAQVQAGMPLATALKEQGWTQDDITEVAKDAALLPMRPVDWKARNEALLLEQEMGASKATLLETLGYDAEAEAAQREAEAETALTAVQNALSAPTGGDEADDADGNG